MKLGALILSAGLVALAAGCGHAAPRPAAPATPTPPPLTAPGTPLLPTLTSLPPGKSPRGPNIVFLLTDDLSGDLLRFMPHVRALARRGTTFSKFIVSDSLCCPSRASIFTGQLPHNTRVFTNVPPDGGYFAFRRHADDTRTFNDALAAHGYRTALAGKYLNGYPAALGGVPRGWSDWAGTGKAYRGYDYTLDEDGRPVAYGADAPDYFLKVIGDWTDRFLTLDQQRPFFLELATFTPHLPAIPAPQDRGRLAGVRAPRGPGFGVRNTRPPAWLARRGPLTRRQLDHIDGAYLRRARSVLSIDRLLGAVQRRLRTQNRLRDTLIVFASDNGLHMGQHRLLPGKKTAFDTDVRVPLIVAGPGVRRGQTVGALVQNTDLAPTFTELAGAPAPATYDGRSLVPFLRGRRPADWRTAAIVEHRRDSLRKDPDYQPAAAGNPPGYEALRLPGATYVQYHDGGREFYDNRRDPAQLHNVYHRLSPARRSALAAIVARLSECRGAAACASG